MSSFFSNIVINVSCKTGKFKPQFREMLLYLQMSFTELALLLPVLKIYSLLLSWVLLPVSSEFQVGYVFVYLIYLSCEPSQPWPV